MNKTLLFSHEEWIVYENVDNGKYVAVSMTEQKRIFELTLKHGSRPNIPAEEKVQAIPIVDSLTVFNGLDLDKAGEFAIELNKLKGTLIPIAV